MLTEVQFEQLYNEHQKIVYNLCLNYVLNPEDAQDVTQEVFVKVYQRFHQYNSASASIKTWICQITINQSLDFLKAKKQISVSGFLHHFLIQKPTNQSKQLYISTIRELLQKIKKGSTTY